MSELSTVSPDPIDYLDRVAASATGRDYKRRLLDALDVRPGHAVLDVGCGPGTDLAALAAAAGTAGTVIGLDHDPAMVETARFRLAGHPTVDIRAGDAHHLPLPDASVDRARADRVLQHLRDPATALAQLRRVVRPGGLVGLAEPDWDTLVVDDEDVVTCRAYTRFATTRMRNPTVGRQLARLAEGAGFPVRAVLADAPVLRDLDTADRILGLRRTTARAVAAGVLAEPVARRWLDRLAAGPFLATVTLFTVVAG